MHCHTLSGARRSGARVSTPPHTRWRGHVHRRILWCLTSALTCILWCWRAHCEHPYGTNSCSATHSVVLAGALPRTLGCLQVNRQALCGADRQFTMHSAVLAGTLPCNLSCWYALCRSFCSAGRRSATLLWRWQVLCCEICSAGRRAVAPAMVLANTLPCIQWHW